MFRMTISTVFRASTIAATGLMFTMATPQDAKAQDTTRKMLQETAATCIGCDTTPGVQFGSAQVIDKPLSRCSKFVAGAVGTYHWVDMRVDVTPGAANWLAHSGYGLNMVTDQGPGQAVATSYVAAHCQSSADPAGFAHHIEFSRSCTMEPGWGFQGAPKVFARYQGCYSKTSTASYGLPVPIYANLGPAKPFLGGGGIVEDISVERAPAGVARRRVLRTTR